MLISTARGIFRRIFRVDQLVKDLTQDSHIVNAPGRLTVKGVTISNGSTSGSVAIPTETSDFSAAVFAIATPAESLGNATEFWVTTGGGNATVNVDVDPGADVSFWVLIVAVGSA